MRNKQIWFITGASRGMGVDFAKAALAARHAVVATGRDTDAVGEAVGKSHALLVVKLDVTSPCGRAIGAPSMSTSASECTCTLEKSGPTFHRPVGQAASELARANPAVQYGPLACLALGTFAVGTGQLRPAATPSKILKLRIGVHK